MAAKQLSTARAIRRFALAQTIRGALIIGVLGGLFMGSYGTIIAKTYPSQKDRDALVATLETTPAINFLSGEVKNAAYPASYAIYKSLPMMVLITAIWGLMTTTRLLRGNEEDGRAELIESGRTTKGRATLQLLAGYGLSFVTSMVVMWVITAALGAAPDVALLPLEALYMTLACFLPGLVFAGLGAATSQLAGTRGRAVMYGLIPLLVLYCIRGAANTSSDLDWLKQLSPFGWSDLLNAVLAPKPLWIIPPLLFAGLFTALGITWAARRDYGVSLLRQPDEVRSHFYLLGSSLSFMIRQKQWTFFWWLVGTLSFVSFMTALAGMVANLLHDTSISLGTLATMSPDAIKLFFVGSTFMILGLILFALTIIELGSIRREEAKSYLDNILVAPIHRTAWLVQRLTVLAGMVLLITIIAIGVILAVAKAQGINLTVTDAFHSSVGVLAGVLFILGVGTFLYGLLPRIAVAVMTLVVAWAFVVDIVRGLFQLDAWIEKTSLLYYIPADPSKSPLWSGVAWLVVLGSGLAFLGVVRFLKRDIITE
jgi:ABC-2 type transport system permease protein